MKYTILDATLVEEPKHRSARILSRRTARNFGKEHTYDNRQHKREDKSATVVIYHGGETISAVLTNISEGGVLLECEIDFKVDSEICLEIKVEGEEEIETYNGRVVRMIDNVPSWFPKVAIEFDLEMPKPPEGKCSL
jgi:PilZ domain